MSPLQVLSGALLGAVTSLGYIPNSFGTPHLHMLTLQGLDGPKPSQTPQTSGATAHLGGEGVAWALLGFRV